jgi:hypothetical protein
MSLPSSGSKNKPSKTSAWSRSLLVACFMLMSCLACSSTPKMRRNLPPKHRLAFNGLHGVISQKTVLYCNIFFFNNNI